jgi:hypothetical protein
MNSLTISATVGAAIFTSGLVGLTLQRFLPAHHTAERTRDMIGGVVGLLTLLLALVLGLLIWTSYGVSSIQQTELQTIATRALEFDLEMRQFGPEGDAARDLLRQDLVWAHEQFWGEDASQADVFDASFKIMGKLNSYLDTLSPSAPDKQRLLAAARANYNFIGEQRILMSMQAGTPVAWPLVYTVAFWSCLLFGGMGLLSRLTPMSVIALACGSASVALSIFLILEYGKPYTGSIRVSPTPLEQAILALDTPRE